MRRGKGKIARFHTGALQGRSGVKEPAVWKVKEGKVRTKLEKQFGVKLEERDVSLNGIERSYRFDLVSNDDSIVGEVKTYKFTASGNIPSGKLAHAGDTCLLLEHVRGAKKKLLILTDKKFYNEFKASRQGEIANSEGIEIMLIGV